MTQAPRKELSPVAFAISLALHLGILFIVPFRQEPLPPPPLRMEVQISQVTSAEPAPAQPEPQPEVEPQPPQPQPVPEKPKQAKKKPSPILTAKKPAEAPVMQETFEVPETAEEESAAEPVEAIEAAPTAPSSEPAQQQIATAPPSTSAISGLEQPQEATDSEAWDGYGQMLYDMVERNKKYPQMAIRRHLEGRVTVSARISMGKLVDISLVDSSGHRVLDEQALEMVRKAASTLPIRNGLDKKSFNVLVPIDFKLQG